MGRLNRQSLGQRRTPPRYLQHWLVRALQVDGVVVRVGERCRTCADGVAGAWTVSEDILPVRCRGSVPPSRPSAPAARNRSLPNRCPPRPPPRPRRRRSAGAAFQPEPSDAFRRRTRTASLPQPARAQARAGVTACRRRARHVPTIERASAQPVDRHERRRLLHETPVMAEAGRASEVGAGQFLVEPEPAPSPTVERQIDRAVAAAPASSSGPSPHWLVAGLSFVCLVESLDHWRPAGQPGDDSGGQRARARAGRACGTSDDLGGASSRLRSLQPRRPRPPRSARPRDSDVKPAAATDSSVVTLTRGWLTIEAPFELQIFEGKTLLGTTRSARLSLLAGPHDLRLVSAALNFETTDQRGDPGGRRDHDARGRAERHVVAERPTVGERLARRKVARDNSRDEPLGTGWAPRSDLAAPTTG